MKISVSILLKVVLLLVSASSYAQSWTNQPDMKVKRSEAAAVDYQGELWVFNGFSKGLSVGNSIEKYNPNTKQWSLQGSTAVANGTAVTHASAVVVGNEAWLIGGRIGSHPGKVSDKVWIYNFNTKKWRVGPKLPIAMAGGGAALVNNKIYQFGGVDPLAKCDVNWHVVYDLGNPNAGWKSITGSAAMPSARNHFSTVVVNNIIYAIGGQHGHDGCPGTKSGNVKLVHSFNPANNQWKQLASLPAIESHNEPSTFVHNGFIYTVGGATAGDKVLRFDPAKNKWEHIANLPEPLLAPVARIYNGRLVVGGGGAPITAKSKVAVRSLGLQKFNDVATHFSGNDTQDNNTNDNNTTIETTGTSTGSGNNIVITVEAEEYTGRANAGQHQWVNASLANATNGGSMVTTPNTGSLKSGENGSPKLSYNVDFAQAGTYHLWVRGWGDENASGVGSNDSLHAGLNGSISATADKIDGFPSDWHWSRRTRDGATAVLNVPSVGVHSVDLWMREDGLAVDQFILTKNASFTPQGQNTTVVVTPSNVAPTVSAGANANAVVGTAYTLQAQASDDGLPNGTLNLQWSKVSGPGTVTFSASQSLSTNVEFSAAGTYVLKLTANDASLSASDTVSITVQANNNNNTGTNDNPVTDANGLIAIEAEDFQNKTGTATHQWVNASLAGASAGASMITTPNKGVLKSSASGSPMLSYSVNFAQTGLYHIWIRGWGDEKANGQGGNDSVHAGLNGVMPATADKIDGFPAGWHWSKRTRDGAPATINVTSKGVSTFNLWMREDGFAVDRIILTKDASFQPSGLGSVNNQTNAGNTGNTNLAPVANAGANQMVMENTSVQFNGVISDDNKPAEQLQVTWTKVSGPGSVNFANASKAVTSATFSSPGTYVLKLTVSDGSLSDSDNVTVIVNESFDNTNQNTSPNADTTIAVEAEDYITKVATPSHEWVAANLNGASGNASMITTPNSRALKNGSAGSPMMSYLVNFSEAGVYYLWVRGWGDEKTNGAGSNDSVHAGLNGNISATADKIDGFPAGWHWSQRTRDGQPARLTIPSAGIHAVNFWMREDGFAIDKFIVTKDASYVPTGTGVNAVAANDTDNGVDNNNTTTPANNTNNTSGLVANANRAWNMVQTANGSSVTARHEAGAVAISNNKFYVMGGRGNRPVQSFNEGTNRWLSHGKAPVLMHHFQPVSIGNKVYVIGAMKDDNYPSEKPLEHIYVFNTSNHTWSKGAAIPQNRRRGSVGAAAHNGKIYLVGGNTNGHSGPAVNWFDEYDPSTGQWRVMPNAPRARDHVTVAIAGGKLVVAGGRRTAHPNVWGDTEARTDVFNFATGKWETSADNIPTKRAGTMAVAVGNEVVVIGGETLGSSNAHRDVEAFNVSTGKWRKLQPLLEGRHSGGAVVLGDKIHVISGNTTRGGGNETINHETLKLDGQP